MREAQKIVISCPRNGNELPGVQYIDFETSETNEATMQIRDAAPTDFDEITVIYNEVLTNTTAIYNDRPVTCQDRLAWRNARLAQGYPVLVATEDNRVLGFGSFGDFRPWPGYRFTVEGTVHIHANVRGRGVGTALLKAIVERARVLKKHAMIAGVDSENASSLRFLERFGFQRVGQLPEVGFKFDRYLDLVLLQYWITPPVRASK
jgi:L-amino acid N-acyltransferase YncA